MSDTRKSKSCTEPVQYARGCAGDSVAVVHASAGRHARGGVVLGSIRLSALILAAACLCASVGASAQGSAESKAAVQLLDHTAIMWLTGGFFALFFLVIVGLVFLQWKFQRAVEKVIDGAGARSEEERRVGKECRSRWSPHQ